MLTDQLVQRREDRGGGADEVGEGRQVEIDALTGIALALPVQRLVLAVLLEEDHRQETGADPAARDDMEGCWRLADPLAVPTAHLLAPSLLHEPAARNPGRATGRWPT
jgi:hypothetical protein